MPCIIVAPIAPSLLNAVPYAAVQYKSSKPRCLVVTAGLGIPKFIIHAMHSSFPELAAERGELPDDALELARFAWLSRLRGSVCSVCRLPLCYDSCRCNAMSGFGLQQVRPKYAGMQQRLGNKNSKACMHNTVVLPGRPHKAALC